MCWSLELNVEKNNGFRKRGRLNENEMWSYGGQNVETVEDFNYLGTVFHNTGYFSRVTEHMIGKSLKVSKFSSKM